MTDSLFFDTDCVSAFLWVGNESLLSKLYPGRVVLPKQVYDELSHPGVRHLKNRIDVMLQSGQARLLSIEIESEAYELYCKLTAAPDEGFKAIGRGEAAAIALAKAHNGILASNNLKDISGYVKEFGIPNLTTGDILKEALLRGYINEAQGNAIWNTMIEKRRKLGYDSFSEYLQSNRD